MKLKLIFATLYMVSGILFIETRLQSCPCLNLKDCNPPNKDLGVRKEIFVFSNGTTSVQFWSWETITTLIVPSRFSIGNEQEANTMCTTHRNGRKFGITVELSLSQQINDTSDEAEEWIRSVVSRQQDWHAEVVTVNLVPYFSSDITSSGDDHVALLKVLSHMKKNITALSDIVKVVCVIPWKPPCAESKSSCDFTSLSKDVCDYFVLNPDSFTDLEDVKCRARATIPFSKLLYGISEYNSHHIPNNRIILGVPWHGYDYTCKTLINDICSLEELTDSNNTKTKCSFSRRRTVSNGDIINEHPIEHEKHSLNPLYSAPFFNYHNLADSHQHQVWFEDSISLITKYRLVAELQLKGVAVMYGDDLSSDRAPTKLINDNQMWTWVAHEFVLAESHKSLNDRLYYADTMAIVAVACLVLGTLLGIVFTCFALRNPLKKPKPPFSRDQDGMIDEYTDEDPNL